MISLQTVDRNANIDFLQSCPSTMDGTESARYDLNMDAPRDQQRHHCLDLAVPHQRVASDEGEVQRTDAVNDLEYPIDECLPLVVAKTSQGGTTAQVSVIVRIATGTPERAFSSDLDRERGLLAFQNLVPCPQHF